MYLNVVSLLVEDPSYILCVCHRRTTLRLPRQSTRSLNMSLLNEHVAVLIQRPFLSHSLTHTLSHTHTFSLTLSLSLPLPLVNMCTEFGKTKGAANRWAALTILCRLEQSPGSAAEGPVGGRGRRGLMLIDAWLGAEQVLHRRK
jgi:hypothetical protein